MRSIILFACLILSGCGSAQGPVFSGAESGTVLYRPAHGYGELSTFTVAINGKQCVLHSAGYVLIPVKHTEISAEIFSVPGTSRIIIDTNEPVFVRIDMDENKALVHAFGGLIGDYIAHTDDTGPYLFTKTTAAELRGLRQDCR